MNNNLDKNDLGSNSKIGLIFIASQDANGEILKFIENLPHLYKLLTADQKLNAIKYTTTNNNNSITKNYIKTEVLSFIADLDIVFLVGETTKIPDPITKILKENEIHFILIPNTIYQPEGWVTFQRIYQGITSAIFGPGIIEVDLEDINDTLLSSNGYLTLGYGVSGGENAAESAALAAVSDPSLGKEWLLSAKGILVSIEASEKTLRLKHIKEVMNIIRRNDPDFEKKIIFSAKWNQDLSDQYQVTVLVAGVEKEGSKAALG